MALLQTMWTSYSFIHDVKSHLTFFFLMLKKLAEREVEPGSSDYQASVIPARPPTTSYQNSETFGYKS